MANEQKESNGSEIKIEDKRRFTSEGELRGSEPETSSSNKGFEEDQATASSPSAQSQEDSGEKDGGAVQSDPSQLRFMPPMDFSTFIMSLYHTTLIHLGEVAPEGQPPTVHLPLAKQSIDILKMLKEKTKGNLNGQESRLVDKILFDLQMQYVNVCKSQGGENCVI